MHVKFIKRLHHTTTACGNGHAVYIPESDPKNVKTGEQNSPTCLSTRDLILVWPTVFGVFLTMTGFTGDATLFWRLFTRFFFPTSWNFFTLVLEFDVSWFSSQLCSLVGPSLSLLAKVSFLFACRVLLLSTFLQQNHYKSVGALYTKIHSCGVVSNAIDQRFPTCAPQSPKGSACTSQGLRSRSRKIK